MPTLAQLFNVIQPNVLSWSAFLALPIILICVACLLPVGGERKYINIQRYIIAGVLLLSLAVPVIIALVNPKFLGSPSSVHFLKRDIFITAALIIELAVILWGAFSARSYITQAIYGMLTTILLPYGFILLVFPVWLKAGANGAASLAAVFSDPLSTIRLIQYALIFFVPVWLIRTDDYKFRLSSIYHLLGGITMGGALGLFVTESGLLTMGAFGKFINELNNKEIFKLDSTVTSVLVFILFAIAICLVIGIIISSGRTILKLDTRNFRSENIDGFICRSAGNIMAIVICGALDIILPFFKWTQSLPGAVVYLVPFVLYLVIVFVSAFIADFVEIKVGIKKARQQEEAANN